MALIKTTQRNKEGEKKPTRYYSSRQEKQIAKDLGGTTTKNSGATLFGGKADVLVEDFALECKTKVKESASITVKKEWIDKLKKDSLFDGKKHYALIFNFGPNTQNYVIIDENTFKELIGDEE